MKRMDPPPVVRGVVHPHKLWSLQEAGLYVPNVPPVASACSPPGEPTVPTSFPPHVPGEPCLRCTAEEIGKRHRTPLRCSTCGRRIDNDAEIDAVRAQLGVEAW